MTLKDFQGDTARRILEVFRSGQNRVLLADEVGLGKTIVAREVVRLVGQWHKNDLHDDHFKVVYICSNVHIARQNASKLGVEEQLDVAESRLSMQHLKIYQSAGRGHTYQQLIPLTPATSFSMTSGCGTQQERALMFVLLRRLPMFQRKRNRLSRFFACGVNWWEYYVDLYEKNIRACDANGSGYLKDMTTALERKLAEDPELLDDLLDHLGRRGSDWQRKSRPLINRLRVLFSQISLEKLEPDLVIMDEFQRFRDLITSEGDSEEAMLRQRFLHDPNTKVLLLSATPYKPYTTLEELATDTAMDNYQEFLQVMDFLFHQPEKQANFHQVWSDYSRALTEVSGDSMALLLAHKRRAEDALYEGISRTERFNTGIIDDSGVQTVKLSQGDILSYDAMQTLLDELERRGQRHLRYRNVPVDYVKSAPYLLSFMDKYQLKTQIKGGFESREDFLQSAGKTIDQLLLRRKDIQDYVRLAMGNARLELLKDLAFAKEKGGAETLLWIPASRPYYQTKGVFAENRGYSKVLVFSSWEMVPRMISIILSYESERRTIGELFHRTRQRRRGYFATREERRFGITRLKNETREIVCLTSDTLAGLYQPEEYLDKDIDAVRGSVKKELEQKVERLRKICGIELRDSAGSQTLIQCVKALDGDLSAAPSAIPGNTVEILVDMAIGSPGICAYRLFLRIFPKGRQKAADCARELADGVFVSLFNKAESSGILDLLYGDQEEDAYYRSVFRYCVEGNLQAVLDEYAHVLDETGDELKTAMVDGYIDTSTLEIDTQETFLQDEDSRPKLRTHFAMGYFNARVSDKSVTRTDNIRRAFNSPFRPFILSTTSIGQEGLDFHLYCRRVMHWNLPSNPVDLEQREGRVNRYKCLAVRQNIAARYGTRPTWEEMFTEAAQREKGDYPDLIPYWCLPAEGEHQTKIERYVPMYPFSQDQLRYARIIKILSLYRLTLGQPRQEELLPLLDKEVTEESVQALFMNLSPFYRR